MTVCTYMCVCVCGILVGVAAVIFGFCTAWRDSYHHLLLICAKLCYSRQGKCQGEAQREIQKKNKIKFYAVIDKTQRKYCLKLFPCPLVVTAFELL